MNLSLGFITKSVDEDKDVKGTINYPQCNTDCDRNICIGCLGSTHQGILFSQDWEDEEKLSRDSVRSEA